MTEHDLLLRNMIACGWQLTHYNPPKQPLTGYLKAYKQSDAKVTRVTWIVKRKRNKLECDHPNFNIHFLKH